LLMGGGKYLAGPVSEILQEDHLSEAFGCRIRRIESGKGEAVFFFHSA
jgi:ABC-type cobalamin transport system ATPase subunit